MSILVFKNSPNHRRLIVHLARDISDRKKNENLLRKMMEVSRRLTAIPDLLSPA